MVAGQLALNTAAFFAGAALYINVAEQPARLGLDERSPQAPLAVIGFLLGLLAWWQTGVWLWLAGGLLLVANWPYTFLVIMPVNNRLTAIGPASAGPESRTLIERWGWLHAGRTALGFAATFLFLLASLQ